MWRTLSTARHLPPRARRIGVWLAGQAKDAFSEDVLVDLGCPTLDRVGAAAEHPPDLIRQRACVVTEVPRPGSRLHTQNRRGRKLDALVELTLVELAHRALRTGGTPGAGLAANPLVRPFPDTLFTVEAHDLVTADGIVPPARSAFGALALRQSNEITNTRTADAVYSSRARARHHLSLSRQSGVGHLPPGTDLAHPARVGNPGRLEEDLVEVDLTAHVTQRANLDAGLVQIDQEIRKALSLGHLGIGPGKQHRPVREVRPCGPHLLPRDDPVISVTLRPGGEC